MWVCSTTPSSKPISRCLPLLSTRSMTAPIDGRMPTRRGASKAVRGLPSTAVRSAAAVRWIVSPSGITPRIGRLGRRSSSPHVGERRRALAPQHQPPVAVGEPGRPQRPPPSGDVAGRLRRRSCAPPGCGPGRPSRGRRGRRATPSSTRGRRREGDAAWWPRRSSQAQASPSTSTTQRAGHPRRTPGRLGPRQRGAVGLGRVGGGEHEGQRRRRRRRGPRAGGRRRRAGRTGRRPRPATK